MNTLKFKNTNFLDKNKTMIYEDDIIRIISNHNETVIGRVFLDERNIWVIEGLFIIARLKDWANRCAIIGNFRKTPGLVGDFTIYLDFERMENEFIGMVGRDF